MRWEAYYYSIINCSVPINDDLLKTHMDSIMYQIFQDFKGSHDLHSFQTSNTFGFNYIPKKAIPMIEKELEPYIKRIVNIKKHKHEWILSGCDGTWIFLKCADKKCDAGKGSIYGKQVKYNFRNFKKYIVGSIKKYPQRYTNQAIQQVEHFEKTGKILPLSNFPKNLPFTFRDKF